MGPNDDNETAIYEVNLEADAGIAGPFDTWLRDHIADMLQFDGFLSAEILDDSDSPAGKIRRIVQYRLRNQAAVERYLREQAPRMRQDGITKFGDDFSAQRRVLAHREEFIRGRVSTDNCLNCGEVLTGQHCSHCGQRAKVRVLSFTGMMRDLLGDIMDFDSRVWRTLRPLAFKPGLLTSEFLRGRRTYYSPPFRMYLILSVVFFLAASIGADPGADFQLGSDGDGGANLQIGNGDGSSKDATSGDKSGMAGEHSAAPAGNSAKSAQNRDSADPGRSSSFELPAAPKAPAPPPMPGGGKTTAMTKEQAAAAARLDEQRRKIIESIIAKMPADEREKARADFEKEFGQMTPEQVKSANKFITDPCNEADLRLDIGSLDTSRLRDACRKIVTDTKGFGRAVFQNIPKMMFIFLPMIAALMFLLYLGSGRYYIEHLLFFVHYHAFFFLCGLAIVVLSRLGTLLHDYTISDWLGRAENLLIFVLFFYVPFYLYRAMRTVYGQGRFFTVVKFSLLGVGYLVFMTLTAVGLLFYTALTL